MRRYLPFIVVGIVGLLTIAGGVMLYRAHRPAPLTGAKPSTTTAGGHESGHVRGTENGPVTLEEFGDYQCPPCSTVAGIIDDMERAYRPQLRVVFRNFPLAMHVHATEAAYAAEAAGLQGRFWQMHDVLYREQAVWSKTTDVMPTLIAYARVIGLDVDRFKADMHDPKVKALVESDQREGAQRGVKSTPTIFINNVALEPNSQNQAGLRAAIDSAVKETSSSKSAGPK